MKVVFCGPLRQAIGCDEIQWPLTSPLATPEFWFQLIQRFPQLEPQRAYIRLARNFEFVDGNILLNDADEVALIPPVSGG